MKRALLLSTLLFLAVAAGCGPLDDLDPQPDPAALDEPGLDVGDEGTGEWLGEPEPDAGGADCAALDLCDDGEPDLQDAGEPWPGAVDGGTDAGVVAKDAGTTAPKDGGTPDAGPSGWPVGQKLLMRGYGAFRAQASSSAALLTAAEPVGGVRDGTHGGGMPLGYIPPGQVVTLARTAAQNGFHQVRYDGLTGWVASSLLFPLTAGRHPVETAMEPRARNAFFKHQLHRSRWNKDGPYSSGTCAPTSLAMAARVFGKEPAGLSIEQAIHRARSSYGVSSDSVGTNRYQIRTGAQALGLSVAGLDTRLSVSSMRSRLDGHLAKKRVVVLEGQSGLDGPSTTYQKAFNRAYAAAGLSATYTFDGRHSVLLLGKQADGKYVVLDPISEVGALALTAAELEDFFARWGGTGNAVWVPQ